MFIRVYGLKIRGTAGALALGLAALAVGGVFLLFGFALLLALGAVGVALGAGVALYSRLTGRHLFGLPAAGGSSGLGPTKEVFPPEQQARDRRGTSRPNERLQPPKARDARGEE